MHTCSQTKWHFRKFLERKAVWDQCFVCRTRSPKSPRSIRHFLRPKIRPSQAQVECLTIWCWELSSLFLIFDFDQKRRASETSQRRRRGKTSRMARPSFWRRPSVPVTWISLKQGLRDISSTTKSKRKEVLSMSELVQYLTHVLSLAIFGNCIEI